MTVTLKPRIEDNGLFACPKVGFSGLPAEPQPSLEGIVSASQMADRRQVPVNLMWNELYELIDM
jgi:hypothetical protein